MSLAVLILTPSDQVMVRRLISKHPTEKDKPLFISPLGHVDSGRLKLCCWVFSSFFLSSPSPTRQHILGAESSKLQKVKERVVH